MPVDVEHLYSASPPLFKHFGGGPAFSDFHFASAFTSGPGNRCMGGPQPSNPAARSGDMSYPLPLRSCLIVRSSGHHQHVSGNGFHSDTGGGRRRGEFEAVPDQAAVPKDADLSPPASPTRTASGSKKKVVFADDRGYALEHVKLMTEPSDSPPRWRDDFVERVTHGVSGGAGDVAATVPHWEPQFAQPASIYLEFRRRLDRDAVSLENVMARDAERQLVGTVKVKNLSFQKEVVVRASTDRWATHTDHPATYVPSGSEGTSVYDLYDTFSFCVPLPEASEAAVGSPYRMWDGAASSSSGRGLPPPLEFCVLFRSEGGREHWDNNGGVNYVVRASHPPRPAGSPLQQLPKFEDAFTARLDSWTEFASWNHLVNDTPYW